MDFEFTDDHEMLRDSVRRYFTERAPLSYVRDRYDNVAVVDDIWRGMADLGLTGMLAPPAHGGAGMGMVDLALPLGEMGRALYPGPFAASAVGTIGLLADLDSDAIAAEWLPRLAAGSAVATVAVADSRTDPVRASEGGLRGRKVHVLDGAAADLLVVVVEPQVIALRADAPGVRIEPEASVDGSRKFASVEFDGARGTVLTGDIASALPAARDRLTVAYVLDGIGAAERALELTLEYAKTREQFGRPIGSFQAVQHLAADMLRALELGRAIGYYAAWACDAADPQERHRAATMAIAFASDDFYRLAANAIQIFGGIGFTWEHDIHLFYKRTLTLQLVTGSRSDHLAELADLVLPPPR
ncbi:MAG: acyl-CoA/acyl-ACP dehydrogenase [Acidimicrobiia bacterium]|nr:acyl-CoA/acyl-ACP dehydrogenase [Acidimicrobiia bacterium]